MSMQTLDAAEFGVPQTRRRLFVICDRLRPPPVLDQGHGLPAPRRRQHPGCGRHLAGAAAVCAGPRPRWRGRSAASPRSARACRSSSSTMAATAPAAGSASAGRCARSPPSTASASSNGKGASPPCACCRCRHPPRDGLSRHLSARARHPPRPHQAPRQRRLPARHAGHRGRPHGRPGQHPTACRRRLTIRHAPPGPPGIQLFGNSRRNTRRKCPHFRASSAIFAPVGHRGAKSLKRAGKRRHTIARLCRRPAAAATRVTAHHPPSHRATDHPPKPATKGPQGPTGMIIIPVLFTAIALPGTGGARRAAGMLARKSVRPTKMVPLFAVKSLEFPKMPATPPQRGRQVHNDSLWLTVGIHMNRQNMCRRAAHHAPLCDTSAGPMCRYTTQFVIILTAICAISVAYGA